MKKSLFTLITSMFLSVAAVAANDQKIDQNDPQKDKEKKNSFSLTEGYFSIFEILLDAPKPDSIRPSLPAKPNNSGAKLKKK